MPLLFSKQPGCHESHLKRRYYNALLDSGDTPTQENVNQANRQDLDEVEAFKLAFTDLMNQAIELKPNTESDVILKLKEDLDKLYEQCAGLAGDTQPYKKGIAKLTVVVMQAVRAGAGNDPTAIEELEQEDIARAMHYQMLDFPVVAHLLRPDSPIQPEELAAVLLGEDEASVTALLTLLAPEQISDLKGKAEHLLAQYPPDANIKGAPYAKDIMNLFQQATSAHIRH